jgi:virulence-associated protein VapD
MAAPRRYKSINFDLDTYRLESVFGVGKRSKGYAAIKQFLTRNGFVHRQWSGYVSGKRLTYAEIYVVIDDFLNACPWLTKCANRFDVTDYMAESDAMEYILSKDIAAEMDDDIV